MSWNYRILKFLKEDLTKDSVEVYYGICEVYYNQKNEPTHVSHELVVASTVGELKEELVKVLKAFNADILNADELFESMENRKLSCFTKNKLIAEKENE